MLGDALTRIHEHFEHRPDPSNEEADKQEVGGGARCTDVVMRTEKLTKVYPGGLKAVDELDLEVHQGEIFGLLGPNGAGKTTTAGMLTTRVIPTSGRRVRRRHRRGQRTRARPSRSSAWCRRPTRSTGR